MPLRLYNTRTRSIEALEPLDGRRVRIYVCGLTPSAEAHLGHARSFLFFDVLRRYLVHRGARVTFVQNVTDVDDRSIAAAHEEGTSWRDVVTRYFASFKRSMQRLHVLEPDAEPRATDYIAEIIDMISQLMERGYAYVASDGVYYRVKAFPRYGALSRRDIEELMIGARIEPGEGKDDPLDFALWKFAKPDEPEWPSPWGSGRPGWHIECSAMSRALLGVPFDIHGGGLDLVFPHHENEIAQSEPLMPHPPMANIWVHGGLLEFDGRKMSKSLGNFEPLWALLDRHDAQAIRLLFLMTGYRKPMNFTESSIASATIALRRLYGAYDVLRDANPASGSDAAQRARVAALRERLHGALDDDMNTAGAAAVIFEVASKAQEFIEGGIAAEAAGFLHEAMTVLGISPNQRTLRRLPAVQVVVRRVEVAGKEFAVSGPDDDRLPEDLVARLRPLVDSMVLLNGAAPREAIERTILARLEAKLRRDFEMADTLREALARVGIALSDTKEGTMWSVFG